MSVNIWQAPNTWIEQGGGITLTADIEINKPVFAAQSSVTDQTTQSNVNFNIAKPVFSVESSVTLPLPTSSVQFTIDKPVFNIFIAASQPIPPIPQKTGKISFGVLGDGINSFGFAGNGNKSSGKL